MGRKFILMESRSFAKKEIRFLMAREPCRGEKESNLQVVSHISSAWGKYYVERRNGWRRIIGKPTLSGSERTR